MGHGCAKWLVTGRLGGGWRGQDAKIGPGQGRAKRYAQCQFEGMSVLKSIMVRHACSPVINFIIVTSLDLKNKQLKFIEEL